MFTPHGAKRFVFTSDNRAILLAMEIEFPWVEVFIGASFLDYSLTGNDVLDNAVTNFLISNGLVEIK